MQWKVIASRRNSWRKACLGVGAALFLMGCDASEPYGSLSSAPVTYQIDTLAELQSIGSGFRNETLSSPLPLHESLAAHYILTANIAGDATRGSGFTPIGSRSLPFRGGFDGNNLTIDGLRITLPLADEVGLFAAIGEEGSVRNLRLVDVAVHGRTGVGGVAGLNAGTIRNLHLQEASLRADAEVGGIAGRNEGRIEDVSFNGQIEVLTETHAGGIVGANAGDIVDGRVELSLVSAFSLVAGSIAGVHHAGARIETSAGAASLNGEGLGRISGRSEGITTTSAAIFLMISNERRFTRYTSSEVPLASVLLQGEGDVSEVAGEVAGGGVVFALEDRRFELVEDAQDLHRRWIHLKPEAEHSRQNWEKGVYSIPVQAKLPAVGVEAHATVTLRADEKIIHAEEQIFSIAENSSPGNHVGILRAVVFPEGSVTFHSQSAAFQVDPQSGVISLGTALDHEQQRSHSFTVVLKASEAADVEQVVTVEVANVLENAIHAIPLQLTVAEDLPPGSPLGKVTAWSSELHRPLTFRVADGIFRIEPNTGQLFLAEGRSLDHETTPQHEVQVGLSSFDAPSASTTVRITVTNVVEEGTLAEPYRVDTLAELQSIATGYTGTASAGEQPLAKRSLAYSLAARYILTADIDASPTASPDYASGHDVGRGFLPIGSADHRFTGSFDGQGFRISGLRIDRPATVGVGLFGVVVEARLKGVVLEEVSVRGAYQTGGLAGAMWESSVEDSRVTGSVHGIAAVGGLVGRLEYFSVVSASYAIGDVHGEKRVGGLVGFFGSGSMISASHAIGDVHGEERVGGLIGQLDSGSVVSASYAIGDVRGEDAVGGLVGIVRQGTVERSYAVGDVHGNDYVGGLVGSVWLGTVERSYAAGAVRGNGTVGGLVGQVGQGRVITSYAANVVRGKGFTGGLVGEVFLGGEIEDVYAFGSVTCEIPSCAAGGLVGISNSPERCKNAQCGIDVAGIGVFTFRRGYYHLDADSTVTEAYGVFLVDEGSVLIVEDVHGVSEAELRALACDATSAFRWDHDDEDTTPSQDCATAGAATFPWDFGTAEEWPVLREIIGGEADAQVQRLLVQRWLVQQFTSEGNPATDAAGAPGLEASTSETSGPDAQFLLGEPITVDAAALVDAALVEAAAGNTLSYHWILSGGLSEVARAADGSSIEVRGSSATEEPFEVFLVIVERRADGSLVRQIFDSVTLTLIGGSPEHPWAIDSIGELQSIATGFRDDEGRVELSLSESLAGHYVLTADIDALSLSSFALSSEDDAGFQPIGNEDNPFTGSFDGQGFRITGLRIHRPQEDDVGLFGGVAGDARLANLALEEVVIQGRNHVGALVGKMHGSTVQNSYSTGSVQGERRVGGLVGDARSSHIAGSYSTGAVSGEMYIGGVLGWSENSQAVEIYATGAVSGEMYIGGVLGWSKNSQAVEIYATGSVDGDINVGGLAGVGKHWEVAESYATGAVSGETHVGGLAGAVAGGLVSESYATGAVSGETHVGGLVGYGWTLEVTESHATGSVDGDTNIGGLVGHGWDVEVAESYATGAVSGFRQVGGLLGQSFGSRVSGSHATGSVDGSISIGGLVGWGRTLEVAESHATGSVDGDHSVGGLVGYGKDSEVAESYATGLVSGLKDVGGLVGRGWKTQVLGSHATGSVSGETHVGGLLGRSAELQVSGSHATGAVRGLREVGGLVGRGWKTQVLGSHATGSVGGGWNVGGLAGQSQGGQVLGSHTVGTVRGENCVGGLLGHGRGAEVAESFATGSVSGGDSVGDIVSSVSEGYSGGLASGSFGVGGLVGCGQEAQVSASYATGLVSGSVRVGGLLGLARSSQVSGSYATGSVHGEYAVGGLVGYGRESQVAGSHATGAVSGTWNVGGLLGEGEISEVAESYATGSVRGVEVVGGLLGWARSAQVSGSYATGSVRGVEVVGGLVGRGFGMVSRSYATGSVRGVSGVGGLVGAGFSKVWRSYATGSVRGVEAVGGLVGQGFGMISRSYATGSVRGSQEVGGLLGYDGGSQVSGSYATGSVHGEYAVGGFGGLMVASVVNDVYALGSVVCTASDCAGGGLIGKAKGVALHRSYFLSDLLQGAAPLEAIGVIVDSEFAVTVGDAVRGMSEYELRALACDTDGAFLWDADGDSLGDAYGVVDDETPAVSCAAAGVEAFSWDFGTADELPVLNGLAGGVLDAAGQRALVAFAREEREAVAEVKVAPVEGSSDEATPAEETPVEDAPAGAALLEVDLAAPAIALQAPAHTLEYHWGLPADAVVIDGGVGQATIAFTLDAAAASAVPAAQLTIFERDEDGVIVRVYGDDVVLVVE